MKKIFLTIVLLHLYTFSFGCMCTKAPETALEDWEKSDLILVGKATEIIKNSRLFDKDGQQLKIINFQILEGFKNIEKGQRIISFDYSDNSCQYSFEVGKTYVIYGHQMPSGLAFTNSCTNTRNLADNFSQLPAIKELREISKERDVKQPKTEVFAMIETTTLERLERDGSDLSDLKDRTKYLYYALGVSIFLNLILSVLAYKKRKITTTNNV
ncbi:hypothetical protein [Rufibacter roseus]|uniref:Tissue inhibitor of metalloproteinase n=1 Tax=Rufibacter roseus TaxID=1567108 RepID=A0ABW2DNM7_9BACT|nr:hypothetical protein [Rufibacter roseus]